MKWTGAFEVDAGNQVKSKQKTKLSDLKQLGEKAIEKKKKYQL